MSKDVIPKNAEGKWHGYCEEYYNGELYYKGVYVNGYRYGYHEEYNDDGSADEYYTGYFLDDDKVSNDNAKGYCYIWCKVVV